MARKSFDIGPKRHRPSGRGKKEHATQKSQKKKSHPQLATRAPKRKLRDRRREAFLRTVYLTLAGAVAVVVLVLYLVWLPALRISTVRVEGYGNADSLEQMVKKELEGSYTYLIPRNSFFFYPERTIRAAILDAYPHIASVHLVRTSFTAVTVKTTERIAVFWWCGTPETLSARTGSCYQVDAEGFVFEKAVERSAEEASTTPTTAMVRVYAPLATASSTGEYPLRAQVLGARALPDVLKFIKMIQAMSIPVASIAIRGDEADLFVEPSTRITYIIGHEREAIKNAEVAFKNLNMVNGSIDYVDLRFDGKVYLKRKGE